MAKRIPSDRVVEVRQRAMLAPAQGDTAQSMTLIPLVEHGEIAGIEIRCRCGSRAVVDCIYDEPAAAEGAR